MSTKSMKRVLESLKAIKVSMHDVAETCASEKVDEAIEIVEQYIEDGCCDSDETDQVLIVIGRALERLPSIVALLKLFSD